MADRYAQALVDGISVLKLEIDPAAVPTLLHFHDLLVKWNKAYNLTAIRDPERMIAAHLLDSLALLPYLSGQRILDVGTGAGLPGLPLAAARPDKAFFLLDSNGKKTRFVRQAVIETGLKNIEVIQQRVEQYRPDAKFDMIVTRAFAKLSDILTATRHLLSDTGTILAMKGRYPAEEIEFLPKHVCRVIPLHIPGIDAERHLVIVPANAIN